MLNYKLHTKSGSSQILINAAKSVGLIPMYEKEQDQLKAVASSDVDIKVLLNLVKTSTSPKVRFLATSHPNLNSFSKLLELSNDSDVFVVAGVCSNPNSPPELLEEIFENVM